MTDPKVGEARQTSDIGHKTPGSRYGSGGDSQEVDLGGRGTCSMPRSLTLITQPSGQAEHVWSEENDLADALARVPEGHDISMELRHALPKEARRRSELKVLRF